MLPLVSVVITTYNRADLVTRRAIRSVRALRYPNLECIVVDDCSTDATAIAVAGITAEDARVRYVRTAVNGGISAARNAGIRASAGEYVAFLDDEDEFDPDYITEMVSFFAGLPASVGAAVTDMRIVYDDGRFGSGVPTAVFWQAGMGNGWMMRRSVFGEGLWFEEGMRAIEDLDFSMRFSERFEYRILHKPLFTYYTAAPSVFRPPLAKKRYADIFMASLDMLFTRHFNAYRRQGVAALAWLYFFKGIHCCQFGLMRAGKTALWQSFRIKPSLRVVVLLIVSLCGRHAFLFIFGIRSKMRHYFL